MKENTLEAKRQSPPRASRREFIQTTVVGAAAVALGVISSPKPPRHKSQAFQPGRWAKLESMSLFSA